VEAAATRGDGGGFRNAAAGKRLPEEAGASQVLAAAVAAAAAAVEAGAKGTAVAMQTSETVAVAALRRCRAGVANRIPSVCLCDAEGRVGGIIEKAKQREAKENRDQSLKSGVGHVSTSVVVPA
jgi:hypothetical protein